MTDSPYIANISSMKEIDKQNNTSDVWEWIKYRLSLKGYTFGKLALIHKVKKTNFTNVKRVHMPKYERLIADYIDSNPWDLWPDRYNADNQPNRISSRYPQHKYFIDHSENINDVNKKNQGETNG